jgi:hypothetical protein
VSNIDFSEFGEVKRRESWSPGIGLRRYINGKGDIHIWYEPDRMIHKVCFCNNDGMLYEYAFTHEMVLDGNVSTLRGLLEEMGKQHGVMADWSEIAKDLSKHKESPAKKAWKTRMANKRKKEQADGLIPRTLQEDIHEAIKEAVRMLR